jgi:hypothetical protein
LIKKTSLAVVLTGLKIVVEQVYIVRVCGNFSHLSCDICGCVFVFLIYIVCKLQEPISTSTKLFFLMGGMTRFWALHMVQYIRKEPFCEVVWFSPSSMVCDRPEEDCSEIVRSKPEKECREALEEALFRPFTVVGSQVREGK